MMKKLLFILVSFPLFTFSQLVPRSVPSNHGKIGFYQFTPAGYSADTSKGYPLIIFLHGVGERGNGTTELPMVLNTSFPKLLAQGATMKFNFHGKGYGFVVLMPQMSKEYINWQNFYVDVMIDYAKKNLKIDTDRIFLCGWSLGGGGAWKYTTASVANARRIAGIVLAAPAPDYTDLSAIAKGNVAVWAHHAKDDASVPIRLTTNAIDTVNSYTPVPKAMVSYYRNGGHTTARDAPFDTLNTYLYPNMYEWMSRTSRHNTVSNNRPPFPIAGKDTSIVIPVKMTLNGSASFDPNDVIVRYRWRMLSGPASPEMDIQSPFSPVTVVKGFEPGEYVFRLTVQDEFGFTRSSDIHVHAKLPAGGTNATPYVNAGRDRTTFSQRTLLQGTSKDFDGQLTGYSWRQIGGPARVAIVQYKLFALINHMDVEGEYAIELSVRDNNGAAGTGRDTVIITKNPSVRLYPYSTRTIDRRGGDPKLPDVRIMVMLMTIVAVAGPWIMHPLRAEKTHQKQMQDLLIC